MQTTLDDGIGYSTISLEVKYLRPIHLDAGELRAEATVVHAGPYDQLPDAYAAIEAWMDSNGRAARSAPWELYVTDPAEHPDPKDWRTEVYWPLETGGKKRS